MDLKNILYIFFAHEIEIFAIKDACWRTEEKSSFLKFCKMCKT